MASPAVVGTPAETAISTAATSHVVNLPSGTTGNLLVAIMSKGSQGTTPTVDPLTGWNELLDEAQTLGLYIAWRVADGTEGATTTFTLSSATRGAWIVYEISGAADPTVRAPEIGTTATGSSTTPNPPSVAVTGGSRDILTIACFGRSGEEADDDTWVTSAPSGFGGLLQKACGTAGTNLGGMIATADLASTTATSDPATFTCATGAWRAQTIVVHPDPTQTSVARISLEAGGAPDVNTDHSIKVRARVTSGSGTIRAALYEGANNRSGDLESSALTTSLADYTLPIAEASAANITDYSDLEIRLWGYSVNGGAIVFEVDQLWLEIPEAALAAYSLDCQPGSYSVTGTAATLAASELFQADPGTYAVTGAAAILAHGRTLVVDPGTYAVTGTDATLLAARAALADPASYAVTGTDATLAAGKVFSADPGGYTVTGTDASLAAGYVLSADPGDVTVAGVDAAFVHDTVGAYTLDVDPGTFAVTGSDATVVAARLFAADPGSFTVTGFDATFNVAVPGVYVIDANTGVFAVSGVAATAIATHLLNADPGAFAVTGIDVALFGEHSVNAAAGTITATGSPATLVAVRELNAEPGAFVFTGIAASVGTIFDLEIDAAPGNFAVTGPGANLLFVPGLARMTTRGGRIRWNTTGGFSGENHAGRITQTKEGAVA